jgi:hypothetical protein
MDDLDAHKHIPEVLATGKFTTARLVRVLMKKKWVVYLFDTVHNR